MVLRRRPAAQSCPALYHPGGMRVFYLRARPAALAITALLIGACGSSTSSAGRDFVRVSDEGRIFDIEEFKQAGLKAADEYDVTGLPGALSAYLDYYQPQGDEPVQYELRFYPDHSTAVRDGTSYADEVTGPDAKLKEGDVRWKEGTSHRRGGGAFRDTITPLYANYAIFNNLILLCEGRDDLQSLGRCSRLLDLLSNEG